jgi:stress-induced morphogen
MKPTHDELLERFRQVFPDATIGVEDESLLHVSRAGAKDGTGPFRVQVIDAQFNELPRIDRHKLLDNAWSDWMPSGCMHWVSS